MGAFCRTLGHPYLIIGDFNLSPSELAALGWHSELGADIWSPTNAEYTCRMGTPRVLDFVVTGNGAT